MARKGNPTDSKTVRVTLSVTSHQLLEQLAMHGIYGRNASEVAARFIDRALEEFTERPQLKTKPRRTKSKKGGDR